ncbi:MAG TPA: saccharopine dehydrogenase NADP-binding domain-containing protein [Longimicrobium sp.]|nr:saccharopine dehydrogenase NADP-binding domain-containing protein [Longimicrobium sp.]
MTRVIVLGGTGFFGAAAVAALREAGLPAMTAARHDADLRVDVRDREALRRALRPGDVVLDAAGPFQARDTALAEAAIDVGFDVVDIADASAYVARVLALADRAAAAGVRILPACSTASAVSHAMIAWSGVPAPVRLTAFLVPTPRHTAVSATASSLLSTVGAPVAVLRDGRMRMERGFGASRRWDGGTPLGRRRGWLFDTPDGLLLPRSHPTLKSAEAYVDPNVPGLAAVLRLAGRSPSLRAAMRRAMPAALPLVRRLGGTRGGFGCEVEGADGRTARLVLSAPRDAYRLAVIPAVLAVRALAAGRVPHTGVLAPHQQVDADELLAELERRGFALHRSD